MGIVFNLEDHVGSEIAAATPLSTDKVYLLRGNIGKRCTVSELLGLVDTSNFALLNGANTFTSLNRFNAGIESNRYSDSTSPYLDFNRTRGSVGSPTQVLNGDVLGEVAWFGQLSGGGMGQGASLKAIINGSTVSNRLPTDLVFYTLPSGGVLTEAGRFDNNQLLILANPLAVTSGGTGHATASTAFNALSPLSQIGDMIYHDGSGNARLAGNQTPGTKAWLSSSPAGGFPTAPVWDFIAATDIQGLAPTWTGQHIFLTGAAGAQPVVFRQTGGVAGTDELQLSHNGTDVSLDNKDSAGLFLFKSAGNSAMRLVPAGGGRLSLANGVGGSLIEVVRVNGGAPTFCNSGQNAVFGAGVFLENNAAVLAFGTNDDVRLQRDAANALALYNGTSAQTFNVYNTRTDASNYERLSVGWSGNVCTIGPEAAGTGNTGRTLSLIIGGNGNQKIVQGGTNVLDLYAAGAPYFRLSANHWQLGQFHGGGLNIETINQAGVLDRAADPIIINVAGGSGAGNPGYFAVKAAPVLASGTTGHTSEEVFRLSCPSTTSYLARFGTISNSFLKLGTASDAALSSNFTGLRINNGQKVEIYGINSLLATFDANDGSFQLGASTDVRLIRDGAADALALRRSTNAQTFRVYNTYTDASNYERFGVTWSGNTCTIATENGGTGTARNMSLQAASGILSLYGGAIQMEPTDRTNVTASLLNLHSGFKWRNVSSLQSASIYIQPNVNPTSTSGFIYTGVWISPIINYSAGTPGAGSYEALKISVTETALPTGTNYLIRASAGVAGNTDKFTVDNSGNITTTASTLVSGPSTYLNSLGAVTIRHANGDDFRIQNNTSNVPVLGFYNSSTAQLTQVAADASDVLSQRRGVNAQTQRWYGTYTDASNYERVSIITATGGCKIVHEVAGTGTARDLLVGTTHGGSLYLRQGDQNRWQVNGSGNFLAVTDNGNDIGATGASRVRSVFVATSVQVQSSGGAGRFEVNSAGQFVWTTRSSFRSPSDGVVTISNNAETDFTRLQFGGVTNAFPSLARSGVELRLQLADGTAGGKLRADSTYGAITADVDGATITFDMNVSNAHEVTLGGNRTLATTNDSDGQVFTLRLKQDGTGSRTVTWWSGISWAGGSAPTLTTTINKADVLCFRRRSSGVYDGFIVGQNI